MSELIQRGRRQDFDRATTAAVVSLQEALARLRTTDGGWGYYPGKASRIESTCWGLLALAGSGKTAADLGPLTQWPREGPWLTDVAGAPINYAFQALASLALLSHPGGVDAATSLAVALLDVRGARFDQSAAIRQDNSLQAWPWIADTFSWVEPTCLALIAVKKMRKRLPGTAAGRIDIGERMLLDRVCGGGGWNYGGSNVYGQELYPYVPTTAWGLIALQDRRTDPTVTRSVERLVADLETERSAPALSLGSLALRTHGRPSAVAARALAAEAPRAIAFGNVLGQAMCLYALTATTHGDSTFTL